MSWLNRIAALGALLMFVSIGVYLILDSRISAGLGLLALAVPMQWMLAVREVERPQAEGPPYDYDAEPPPLSVLAAFLIAGICFIVAVVARR